jgi:transposase
MTDLKQRHVLEVVPGRSTADAVVLLETLPEDQRKAVVAAAMDMGANFAAATRKACPQAAIVHDRFHISMYLNEAVDKVRRQEHRRLLEEGDTSLTGARFLWLQGAPTQGKRALTFDELCERNLKTERVWYHEGDLRGVLGPGDRRTRPTLSHAVV